MQTADFEQALNEAISAIVNLREEAQSLRDELDNVIDACETIEETL